MNPLKMKSGIPKVEIALPAYHRIMYVPGVLFRCSFVPQIMHGRAPEVFLHQLSWNIAI
jgi:hypothetical protein